MRRRLAVAALLSATCASGACATAVGDEISPTGELAISLSRSVLERRPILVVTITNRSASPICIQAEVLKNPNSEEMHLIVRNVRGRTVRLRWREGFIIPSIPGLVRLRPGEATRGQYYLDWRLGLREGGRFPRGMSAHVTYEYTHCDESAPLRAPSAWQPL